MSWLVSWMFEPSQPQRIISGLKANLDYIRAKKQTSVCVIPILHPSHQTTNSLKSTKSVLTQIYRNHTNIELKIFKELVPLSIAPV